MSILTNFLKLVKPEKNDYVDVEEHISNNLDKIDEKMENFNLNKLDKGGYTGTAQNLLTEISKIASKTVLGRMIVGKGLTVDSSSGRTSVVSKNDGIIVNDNDIQLNVYDGVDSTSTTRAGSARAIKMAYDKGVELDNLKIGARNDGLPTFDGTYGDFANKVKAGIYRVDAKNTIILLGLDTNIYEYGMLEVFYSSNGIILNYYPDTTRSRVYSYTQFNFKNNPTYTFSQYNYWKKHITSDDIVNNYSGGADKLASAEIAKSLDENKQNKTDNGLTTSNKTVVGAINESLPWNNNQKYSKHYYHDLWNDAGGINKTVYEHLYPIEFSENPDAHKGIVSRKEIRLWTGEGASNPMGRYLLELNGKLSYRSFGIDYIFYNQNNIGNIKELWVNSSNALIKSQNIVLSEVWSNFQTIIIEVCNYTGTANVDYAQIMLETSLLRTNNTATTDNQENDYTLSFYGDYHYRTVYFRDDKKTIYFGETIYTGSNTSNTNLIRIKRIIGVNRKVGVIQ